jgi:hypothetical protein
MTQFDREEVKAAFDRRIELQDADDWQTWGMTFTEDAVYVEHHEGTFIGRQAILEWLIPVMRQCKGWTYPTVWQVIDGNRSVHKWLNRLPGQRADGSHYEFAGLTVMDYAGDGLFSYQEDLYNWEKALPILKQWAGDQRAKK